MSDWKKLNEEKPVFEKVGNYYQTKDLLIYAKEGEDWEMCVAHMYKRNIEESCYWSMNFVSGYEYDIYLEWVKEEDIYWTELPKGPK